MPIAGVGVKPDGTLGWVDAQGYEVNPDGSPMQDAQQLQSLQPATPTRPAGAGAPPLPTTALNNPPVGSPPTPPATPAAPAAGNTARDALVKVLAAQYGGQVGTSSPVLTSVRVPANAKLADGSADPNAGKTLQQETGRDLYTFGDGTSIELTPDGSSSNFKLGPGVGTAGKTGPDVMAQSGQILAPNGQVYIKNTDTSPGALPYVLDTNSQNNQQLANAKTVADTSYQTAQAKKLQIDNAIASETDPAKLAQLQNDKTQAEIDVQKANAAKTTADIAYQQGMLGVSQTNAAATTSNAASTAARVGSQNQLDVAQANKAAIDAAVSQGRLPSQVALDTAQAANQNAAAAAALAKAKEPTPWTQNTTAPSQQYYDPTTGKVVTQQNPSYVPTDPGRMTAQLKQQADQKWAAIQQQVANGSITGDQAQSQFNQYWDENIEPVKGDIAAAQAKAQSALQYQQAQTGYQQGLTAMLPANLAETASNNAQQRAISMMPYMINSNAAANPGVTTGKGGWPVMNPQQILQNATFSLPNLQEIGRQGAAAALANISPTAAWHAQQPGPVGQPQVGGVPDLTSMLSQSQYGGGAGLRDQAGYGPQYGLNLNSVVNTTGQPGGAQVGGPPTPVPPPPPPVPPGVSQQANPGLNLGAMPGAWGGQSAGISNPQWYQDLLTRQQQDAAAQGIQAQIPWGQYTPVS